VRGEERGESAFVLASEDVAPFRFSKNSLDHEGIDEDERGLEQVQRQHREFVLVTAVAGELTALAEEDDVVDAVPPFDDVQPGVDLPLQLAVI